MGLRTGISDRFPGDALAASAQPALGVALSGRTQWEAFASHRYPRLVNSAFYLQNLLRMSKKFA